jgi:C_GCAxxG_C_C family probable redox protein
MNKPDLAVATFKQGYSCSQAVLSAYAPDYGVEHVLALRLGAGFGGGMGRMGEVCGALTGAFMVLGLKHGAIAAEDHQAREKTHQRVRELARRFKERHGALRCRELTGCDLSTPEGYEHARQQGVFRTLCPQLVHDAAAVLGEVL